MSPASILPLPRPARRPELDFLPFDLNALFTVHMATLTVMQEAHRTVLGAAEAMAKLQYDYSKQIVADAQAAFATRELPKAATIQAAAEKAMGVAKEVMDLAAAAQQRVLQLLATRSGAAS